MSASSIVRYDEARLSMALPVNELMDTKRFPGLTGGSVPIVPSEPKTSFEPPSADDEEGASTIPTVEDCGLFSSHVVCGKLLFSRLRNKN